MDWMSAYPALRHGHIALAALSVGLFAARGLGVLCNARWPMAAAVRGASVLIDVGLLLAGVSLALLLRVHQAWLPAKLGLLLLYIVLGSLALKRAPTRAGKALAYGAALLCVGLLVSVARARHPLGVFA